ncbi:hypothetical protein ACQW02_09110 [Humitalea sp. 24SJ18S-53]|uniref:hypothetical protein n=1 Tax=Humitalea sp. 24SJ18S-53 TaxID=3422307 RepID=UPI003D676FD4
MSTRAQQLQTIVGRYQKLNGKSEFLARDVAEWAISQGLWQEHPSAVLIRCAEEISRAMREEYVTDAKGRKVRTKHAVTCTRDGKQLTFWADMRTAPRQHMELAFRQRRQQILGDCRQLKTDVDSYNEALNTGAPIQIVFDFMLDLEELELAAA